MSTPDLFDVYFQRADTDRDGRISGQEAVSFFQGANLHREILAKIWQYADQGQTGYLSRAEFYNALKLVTVAQTGRELTPAIVSRALNGPAALQIPPPQIQFTQGPAPVAPLMQPAGGGRSVRPVGSPTQAYQQYPAANASIASGPVAPTDLNKQGNLSALVRPASTPTDWPTNKSSSWPGPASNNSLNGAQPSPSITQGGSPSGPLISGANSSGIKSDFDFGDVFTAVPGKPSVLSSQALLNSTAPQIPQPTGAGNQISQRRGMQEMGLASFSSVPSSSTPAKALQPVSTSVGQPDRGIGPPPGVDASKTWPKMTDAIVHRYTKIFFDVDTDKDGRISGTQARDLFLSWQLPREVLKQIWDLSDQDHDSMLSLREFCVALYLMERHRERQILPAAINAANYFDESGIQALRISEAQVAVAQTSAGYNLPAWRQNPGVLQAPGPGLPPRPVLHGIPGQSPVRGSMSATGRGGFVPVQMPQANLKGPAVDMKQGHQLASSDSSTLRSKHQQVAGGEKKVQELEKQIMDSKEKMDFYRTNLQDVVLFKTRCDNRLAEIADKAAADKREVEALAKRYEEKYKQAGESQSRLLADEAIFRDIQERRLELQNALVRMEQGGDLNAFLQVRADRLQNDLHELKKVLNAKCKQFGLRMKPISVLEIPFGWQPGIQVSAAEWEEEWDKFEEEGFECVQEFMEEGSAGSDASKPKSLASWDESEQHEDDYEPSSAISDVHVEEASMSDKSHDSTPLEDQRDKKAENRDKKDLADSKQSGSGMSSIKDTWDPHKHNHMPPSPKSESDDFLSNGGERASNTKNGTMSNVSWEASHNYDIQAGKPRPGTTFGLDDSFDKLSISSREKDDLPSFGPIRTKERPSVFFDASVPSTPLHSSYSPGPISGGSFFDDSVPSTPAYGNNASAFGSTRESLVRFDSFSSISSDFPHSSDTFARFDSFSSANSGPSSRGFTSFDEPDPLGNGSFGGQHAKRSTDTWSAFG